MAQRIYKPDYNEEIRVCDFSTVLDIVDNVSTVSAIIVDKLGTDLSSTMLASVVVSGDAKGVKYTLKGGVVNKTYQLAIRAIAQSGQKLEENFDVRII